MKTVEVDFGPSLFQTAKVFNVADITITLASSIVLSKLIKSPSDGRDIDEIFAETLEIAAAPKAGSLDIYVKSLNGSVTGKFLISYSNS